MGWTPWERDSSRSAACWPLVRARSRARDTSRGPRPRAPPRRPCPPGTRISFFPWRPVYASQTALAGRLAVQLREQLLAGEELGLVGCLLILALLGAILFRCVWLAHRSRDPLFAAVAMGVAGVFGAQTILNIGMCLYVAPVVGVTLPFFSYGGSSLVTLFTAMGFVSGIKKRTVVRRRPGRPLGSNAAY